jgi:hypothetical protein
MWSNRKHGDPKTVQLLEFGFGIETRFKGIQIMVTNIDKWTRCKEMLILWQWHKVTNVTLSIIYCGDIVDIKLNI